MRKRERRKKLLRRILIGLATFVVIGALVMTGVTGWIVFSSITRLSTNEEATVANSVSFFREEGFDYDAFQVRYTIEKVALPSTYDDHVIPGDFIHEGERDRETILMIHGLGPERHSILPFAQMFLERGYNVMLYDQRSAGANTAPYTTFGYLESYDAADCLHYLDSILSEDTKIHLWGVSNGGATAGIALSRPGVEARLSSVMLDCAISNTTDMLISEMGKMGIPLPMGYLLFSGDLVNRLMLGFSYKDASAEECLKNTDLPVLILATRADELTPFFMAEKLHAAAPQSVFAYVEDSAHCDEFFDHPEWYEEQVFGFLP